MLHPPSSASQRIINEPRYLNELADNIASLKIACDFCTSGHTLPAVLPPSWRTIFEHWRFLTYVSARDLRSFETSRFEFDSKVTTRLHMPCAVIPQTTLPHCSTKTSTFAPFVVEIYVYNSTLRVAVLL